MLTKVLQDREWKLESHVIHVWLDLGGFLFKVVLQPLVAKSDVSVKAQNGVELDIETNLSFKRIECVAGGVKWPVLIMNSANPVR